LPAISIHRLQLLDTGQTIATCDVRINCAPPGYKPVLITLVGYQVRIETKTNKIVVQPPWKAERVGLEVKYVPAVEYSPFLNRAINAKVLAEVKKAEQALMTRLKLSESDVANGGDHVSND
jgi:hypothetical protein